jgi:hypothetical protein
LSGIAGEAGVGHKFVDKLRGGQNAASTGARSQLESQMRLGKDGKKRSATKRKRTSRPKPEPKIPVHAVENSVAGAAALADYHDRLEAMPRPQPRSISLCGRTAVAAPGCDLGDTNADVKG